MRFTYSCANKHQRIHGRKAYGEAGSLWVSLNSNRMCSITITTAYIDFDRLAGNKTIRLAIFQTK